VRAMVQLLTLTFNILLHMVSNQSSSSLTNIMAENFDEGQLDPVAYDLHDAVDATRYQATVWISKIDQIRSLAFGR